MLHGLFAVVALAGPSSAAAQTAASAPAEVLPSIVLLLPGQATPFARAAEAVRAGFFAAHAAAGAPMAIESRESDETAAAVVAALDTAVARGARLVVGPLSRDAVDALARGSGPRLPVLALSQPSGAAPLPPQMLAIGLRIEDEARAIVASLLRGPLAPGVTSERLPFAVIIGRGPLERRAAAAFIAAAQEQGRPAEAFELSLRQERLNDLGKRLAARPWQAILLALDAGEASAVRGRLPPDVPAVATSRVHLLEHSSIGLLRDLDGIAFVDMPWLLEPDHPAVMAYPRPAMPFSAELERLYALGIDAYRIAVAWLGGSQRFDLDGVTGRLRLDPALGGRIERWPSLAVFVDGKPQRRDVLR